MDKYSMGKSSMGKSIYIESDQLYLRNVTEDDVTDAYYNWLNDPDVNQYLETRFSEQTREDILSFVKIQGKSADSVFLAICLKENHRHIGNIKLGPINPIHKFGDISLFIGDKSSWGKGYATQAISMITEYAFTKLKIHKVKAGCYSGNIGSQKAFEKAGFSREGILKKEYLCNGKYVDALQFGKLNPDDPQE